MLHVAAAAAAAAGMCYRAGPYYLAGARVARRFAPLSPLWSASRPASSSASSSSSAASGTPAVFLIGGTGFIGKHVKSAFARSERSVDVNVVGRSAGRDGRPNWISADVASSSSPLPSQLPRLNPGATVVNLVGIMHEQRPLNTFENVNVEGARRVAEYAKAGGARLIHLSAILPPGAEKDPDLKYASSKAKGEVAVKKANPDAVIIRPSLVFGPEDDFFNRFNRMASFLPFLPVFAGGQTRFQPVYVDDLANAIVRISDGEWARYKGKIIEAGGPKVYTYRELMEICLNESGKRRLILNFPWALGMGSGFFMEKLPVNLFTITRDQVRMLRHDNIVRAAAGESGLLTLADIGLTDLRSPEGLLRRWMRK